MAWGLHVALDVEVEKAIEEAHAAAVLAVRDPHVRPPMMRLQMLDDAARFRDRHPVVEQDREFPDRPQLAKLFSYSRL